MNKQEIAIRKRNALCLSNGEKPELDKLVLLQIEAMQLGFMLDQAALYALASSAKEEQISYEEQ